MTRRRKKIDDSENFESAYAITVHKAQGSEFEHVFFVLPKKESLLTKRLVYTALTRSQKDFNCFFRTLALQRVRCKLQGNALRF